MLGSTSAVKNYFVWLSFLNLDVAGDVIQKIYLGNNANHHSALFNCITCICWE